MDWRWQICARYRHLVGAYTGHGGKASALGPAGAERGYNRASGVEGIFAQPNVFFARYFALASGFPDFSEISIKSKIATPLEQRLRPWGAWNASPIILGALLTLLLVLRLFRLETT